MVDLMGQYSKIKNQIDRNIISSIDSGRFVNGPIVTEFSENLSTYLMDQSFLLLKVKEVGEITTGIMEKIHVKV